MRRARSKIYCGLPRGRALSQPRHDRLQVAGSRIHHPRMEMVRRTRLARWFLRVRQRLRLQLMTRRVRTFLRLRRQHMNLCCNSNILQLQLQPRQRLPQRPQSSRLIHLFAMTCSWSCMAPRMPSLRSSPRSLRFSISGSNAKFVFDAPELFFVV